MRLTSVRITSFKSVRDSGLFSVGDITCLVGKNEAGKTALLQALYRLNPVIAVDGTFDHTDDFPRSLVVDYERDLDDGRREPAPVVAATFSLDPDDIDAVEKVFGTHCFTGPEPTLTLTKDYSNALTVDGPTVSDKAAIKHLVRAADIPSTLTDSLLQQSDPASMAHQLQGYDANTNASAQLAATLAAIAQKGLAQSIYDDFLSDRVPQFLYFDEYYQLTGQDRLDTLRQRVVNTNLLDSDHPLLGLLSLARLDLDDLLNPRRTERLIARLEAAANKLTSSLLRYWSQNRHLRMQFDIRPGQSDDPPDLVNSPMNLLGRVTDIRENVSTPFAARSRGFVWFFSFLAWYEQFRREGSNIILLLDEPGLSLHGKAQEDLLRYFEEELQPHHQLVYTTHSPFMVDPTHFDRVRIVQDPSMESAAMGPTEERQGTEVITEILEAMPDSLFPLQGALGYEIYQTLFVGPNSLVVEGVSDLLYLQTMSALVADAGGQELDQRWTITPVGGASRVPTFVALLGAQTNLNVAVLLDYQDVDKQRIENLYKRKLLQKHHVLTYADYVDADEADVEDLFDPEFYLELVNKEFLSNVTVDRIAKGHPRILRRLEGYFEQNPLSDGVGFNHYRPARCLAQHVDSLADKISEAVLDRFGRVFRDLNELL